MDLIEPQFSAAVTEPYALQLSHCISCAELEQARAEIAEADKAAADAHKKARTQCFAYAGPQALE